MIRSRAMRPMATHDRRAWLDVLIIVIVCLAGLLPFVNKAFHIDDTLFLMSARQILAHPLNFFGCDVNWYGTAMRMSDVNKNPPLTSYFIALVATFAGFREIALHIAFLL